MVKNDLLPFMQKIIAALKILSSLGCCFFNFLIFVLLPGGSCADGGPARAAALPGRGSETQGAPRITQSVSPLEAQSDAPPRFPTPS